VIAGAVAADYGLGFLPEEGSAGRLKSAGKGALFGAGIGSILPGPGTAIGGILGAFGGEAMHEFGKGDPLRAGLKTFAATGFGLPALAPLGALAADPLADLLLGKKTAPGTAGAPSAPETEKSKSDGLLAEIRDLLRTIKDTGPPFSTSEISGRAQIGALEGMLESL